MEGKNTETETKKRAFYREKGMIYFDKKTERVFFFVLTLIMLVWGLIEKIGLFAG